MDIQKHIQRGVVIKAEMEWNGMEPIGTHQVEKLFLTDCAAFPTVTQ